MLPPIVQEMIALMHGTPEAEQQAALGELLTAWTEAIPPPPPVPTWHRETLPEGERLVLRDTDGHLLGAYDGSACGTITFALRVLATLHRAFPPEVIAGLAVALDALYGQALAQGATVPDVLEVPAPEDAADTRGTDVPTRATAAGEHE